MNIESFLPFLLVVAPFAIAFFTESLVLYYFRLRPMWGAIAIATAVNLLSLAIIFFAVLPLIKKLGYELSGFNLQPQVMVFLWWFSSVADGVLLTIFLPKPDKSKIFAASILMNFISFLFLYIFIVNSH